MIICYLSYKKGRRVAADKTLCGFIYIQAFIPTESPESA